MTRNQQQFVPTRSSARTGQAARILQWIDRHMPAILRELPEDDHHRFQTIFRQARYRKGAIEQADVRAWRGGPRLRGVRMPVCGTEDEQYGHIRVEAVVQEMIIPLIECGAITPEVYHQLYQRLRGSFAGECQRIQRAWWIYRAQEER